MASDFCKLGSTITGASNLSYRTQIQQFKTHFGINPSTCHVLWKRINCAYNVIVSKTYLLWSLYFLCVYPKVKVIRKVFEVDVKTFRKHARKIIFHIKNLKIVSNICKIYCIYINPP